ncbi:MAG: T9SS type A sorting domain-containing protein [Fluviicola sp.]|nr:T9SS type A sorting domain-containing protein [Fluviicola sp.]
MKNLIVLLFISSHLFSYSQDQWIIKDSINGAPRSAAASFVANGEGFIVTGLDDSGFRRKNYSYTYWQDDWDSEPSLGGLNGGGLARGSASGFSIGTKGYICLGQTATGPFMRDLWEYDAITKVWTQKADFIGEARRSAVAFTINGLAFVGTGISINGLKKDMYKYNSFTNSWIQMNDFGGSARQQAVGFSMDNLGYIGTGDDGVYKNDFWQYNIASDSWIQKANMPGTARKGAVGWGIFPTAFICTGEDINFVYTKDLWEYNYFTDSWAQRADYIGPGRSNAIAFVIQEVAFVGSGYNGVFLDDLYAYRRIVGLEEQEKYSSTSIYPNPVESEFNIKVNPKDLSLELFSIEGKNVTSNLVINQTSHGFNVTRKNLRPGTYIVLLNHKELGNVYQSKLIFAQ